MENKEAVISVTETEEKELWIFTDTLSYKEYLQLPLYLRKNGVRLEHIKHI